MLNEIKACGCDETKNLRKVLRKVAAHHFTAVQIIESECDPDPEDTAEELEMLEEVRKLLQPYESEVRCSPCTGEE